MNANPYRSEYDYAPGECDVLCATSLERFRAKRDEWVHWLRLDEHHAIANQITAMLWSDAVFRLINESRKHAADAGGGFATQSGIIARALDQGYVAEQVIAFRRLTEPGANDPKRQVISVRRLLDDIKANRDLLTREMFVCHDGLPFDDRGGVDDLPPPDANGISISWVDTSGPRAFGMSNLQHGAFDRMMDTPPARRARNDKIGDRFFEEMEKALRDAPFDAFRRFANKMLLHAADGDSRGTAPIEGVTLDKIWACHKAILFVANRLSLAIGDSNLGGVPTPQYDVLEHWDAPFAPPGSFDALLKQWKRDNRKRQDWTQSPPET